MPSHLVKIHDGVKYVLKHVAMALEALPDSFKTTVCKLKAACKSAPGAKLKPMLNNAITTSGEVITPDKNMACRGEETHERDNPTSRIGLEIPTFFTLGTDSANHRIYCEVPDNKEPLVLSVTAGGGATGTEPVLPPNSSGAKAIATETTDETSGGTDKESLVSPCVDHVKWGT